MRSRGERLFAIALGVLLLALALAAEFLQPGSGSQGGSVASAEPHGRRALLLLLDDLGFDAQAWTDPPGALPRHGALLWLARAPEHATVPPGNRADAPSPAEQGLRALSHYRRFVEEGGTLVLAQSDFARSFLVDALDLEACSDVHASRVAKAGLRRIRDDGGEELEVEVKEGGVLVFPGSESRAEVLWSGGALAADGDDVLAMAVTVGAGKVVLLGDDGFLDNDAIGKRDHALFAVRLAEELAPGKHVLFDEYALGLEHPRTAVAMLASPRLFLATFHALVLLALLVLRSGWVREFPRDPAPLESASPLLRARTLGALLARAGRFDVLARMLRDGVAQRLDRRSGTAAQRVRAGPLAPCASAEDLARWNDALGAMEREAG